VLCDDPVLRTAMLDSLPTLDESGMAVRQTGGRDPHRRIQIFDAPAGAPSLPAWLPAPLPELPAPLPWAPAPWIRAKGLQVAPSPEAAPGCRRKRGDVGCTVPTDRFFSDPPSGAEEAGSQKRQRAAGGAEETGSQA
jgi:hypothetical protein